MLELLLGLISGSAADMPSTPPAPPSPSITRPKGKASEPQPIGDPIYWIDADDYPTMAARLHLEGNTTIELVVGIDGSPQNCVVTESSGHDLLDKTACTVMRQRGRFHPARDAAGNLVEGKFRKRLAWRLPEAENLVEPGATIHAELTLEENGTVTGCTIDVKGLDSNASREFCPENGVFPDQFISLLRSSAGAGKIGFAMDVSFATSPEAQNQKMTVRKGWERIALVRAIMDLNSNGWLSECMVIETRGDEGWMNPVCERASLSRYAAPSTKDHDAKPTRYWYSQSFSVQTLDTK